MHVKDARQFVASTPHRVVPGDTLVFDFVFFLHPVRGGGAEFLWLARVKCCRRCAARVCICVKAGLAMARCCTHLPCSVPTQPARPALNLQTAIGHWSEMLFPLFSILRQERSFSRPPTQFLQLHLKRCHMMEWVSARQLAFGWLPSQRSAGCASVRPGQLVLLCAAGKPPGGCYASCWHAWLTHAPALSAGAGQPGHRAGCGPQARPAAHHLPDGGGRRGRPDG